MATCELCEHHDACCMWTKCKLVSVTDCECYAPAPHKEKLTIKEMKARIETHCACTRCDDGCPLLDSGDNWCAFYEGEEDGEAKLRRHYEILFGGEEE